MTTKMQVVKPSPIKKDGTKRKRTPKYTAASSDRYELYQLAVQSPETDIEFLSKTYRRIRGKAARHMREDFCGTALLCSEWVKQGKNYTAEGFDLDPEPLEWGRERNLAPLGEDASRITLHLADARDPGDRAPDVHIAQNFSYFIFQKRNELLEYFKGVRRSLATGGIFVMDMFGGDESTTVMTEERKIEEGFTYVWDQAVFFPGTNEYHCKIHFHFKDGSKLKNAFTYEWRFYSMSELRDILADAGFGEVHAYFEEADEDDEDGDGNGEFLLDEKGESSQDCEGWIAYLVAYD
jgi:SAM-dependent methyltransferase